LFFCSVELTLWAVIDWAVSISAYEGMGETCPSSFPPGFLFQGLALGR
jgi:hypothetical protein